MTREGHSTHSGPGRGWKGTGGSRRGDIQPRNTTTRNKKPRTACRGEKKGGNGAAGYLSPHGATQMLEKRKKRGHVKIYAFVEKVEMGEQCGM